MPIKILHLIDTATVSGPGKTIINSCRFADPERFEKHVAAFSHAGRNQYLAYVREQGIVAHELCERYWWLPGILSHVAVVFALRSLLRKEQFDLLHAHGFKSDVLGFFATRGLNVRMVTTQHGFICNTIAARLYNRLAIAVSRRMDRVVAVSEKLRDRLVVSGVPESKVRVIHNAIVTEDYPPRAASVTVTVQHQLEGGHPILCSIGRLSPEKGQDVLCRAVAKLLGQFPSLRLVFVGAGPDLEKLQETYRIHSRNILFVGHVSDIRPYLSVADLHVLPSYTEGLPNVVLEAACMGIPTVATAVGGTPECVRDGETGILVQAGDANQLADAIRSLVSNEQRRKNLGANAISFVQENYGFDRRVRKMAALYEELFRP